MPLCRSSSLHRHLNFLQPAQTTKAQPTVSGWLRGHAHTCAKLAGTGASLQRAVETLHTGQATHISNSASMMHCVETGTCHAPVRGVPWLCDGPVKEPLAALSGMDVASLQVRTACHLSIQHWAESDAVEEGCEQHPWLLSSGAA